MNLFGVKLSRIFNSTLCFCCHLHPPLNSRPASNSTMAVNGIVLLTGGPGHVGFATLKTLLQHGYTVHATVRSEAKALLVRSALADRVKKGQLESIIISDFLQDGAFDKAAKGVKYIVHVASPPPSNASEGDDLEVALVKPAV
jgi:nucleoside-diphosphate-sugar epimerase